MTIGAVRPAVRSFFHRPTNTFSHVVWDPAARVAAVVDPVLDYEPRSARTATAAADAIIAFVERERLDLAWILETHAHADHLTAAPYIKDKLGGVVAIGEHIVAVQRTFRRIFNLRRLRVDGSDFDRLLADGESLGLGELTVGVMHTPGHTPACVTYVAGDAAFIGDTLFMPDYGTARADFPGGHARTLYRSIKRILALPAATRLYLCHDYLPPSGRSDYRCETTVAAERAENVMAGDAVGEAAFVLERQTRDRTLTVPALILPALQVNIRAGRLPAAEANGIAYLRLPLNMIG
jgi:glyoxylase-like metal-dependent hydrolase (beta-lactamase superfamily II)